VSISAFAVAIIAPLLYALTNHIDKILLEKYFKEGGVGTLILFSSLLSAFAIPVILIGDPAVLAVSGANIALLAFVGVLNVFLLWCYLQAMFEDEASVVIVFYQLVPVLGLVFGYFILGEVISSGQLLAMVIIIAGTSIVSFEIGDGNKIAFRRRTVLYMLAASSCWAFESVLFKRVALEEDVWRSLFWEHAMMLLVGVMIFAFVPKYRRNFIGALRANSKNILALNVANEALYITGNIVVAFAYMLAPVSLVLLAESFQPIFVLLLGVLFTLFLPGISRERISAAHFSQKLAAVVMTGLGTYLLLIQ
jgi:drug/metabolite transporter (DMT)-like permease